MAPRTNKKSSRVLTFIEGTFEVFGKWKFAHDMRRWELSRHKRTVSPVLGPWFGTLLALDARLREITERQAVVEEQYENMKVEINWIANGQEEVRGWEKQLSEWRAELKSLHQQYWSLEYDIYDQEAVCPAPAIRRAFVAFRENPERYLFPWLCEDCAGRGGDCGLICECGERAHAQTKRECGCGRKARGFDLDAEMRKLCGPSFDLSGLPRETFSLYLMRAYVWGRGDADAPSCVGSSEKLEF
ncbi:hypothetical protein N7474_002203 [Penicillium riverlandense]|uniref:uncharacterized protein n=1 Tax=Penicillium riverlandense TaxID=1903569 RepID=UPI0025489D06|nr:uncharacterized protein N7474_002203 [Penicillium riverlandense]KAJ5833892.1 hypothetical protein N7474_002203 [Penicillium riverlandense]